MYIVKKFETNIEDARILILNGETVYVTADDRGIGKTTLIQEISKERNIPVISPTARLQRERGLFKKNIFSVAEAVNMVGVFDPNQRFLVDDVSKFELDRIEAIYGNRVSGFVRADIV